MKNCIYFLYKRNILDIIETDPKLIANKIPKNKYKVLLNIF